MTKLKKIGVLMGLLMMCASGTGWSTANSSNDSDSLTIRITPNVDKGVQIDTATYDAGGAGYISLGTVDLYASTYTVRPATVTILGNLGSSGADTGQELDVSGTITGGWTFDTTPTVGSTSGEINALAVYLLFSDTTLSAAPAASDFSSGSGAFTGATTRAGGSSGNDVLFEYLGDSTDMDDLSADDTMHLWMYFRLPNQTSTGSAQDVTMTLSAADAS